MSTSLPVVNLQTATYECIFGRGCDGICCQNGRPPIYPEEIEVIDGILPRLLDELRPEARELVEENGYISGRKKRGLPMLRVVGGWCVFFNKGCTLHKLGIADGDSYRYKPAACALFPLSKEDDGKWYVRQWHLNNEDWDVFCLNPKASTRPASESLQKEMELAARYDAEAAASATQP